MKLFLKLFDFSLPDTGVNYILHLFLQLILSLPKQNLPFTLNNLIHELSFLLSNYIDVILKLGCLMFHLLKFFDQFTFQVDILVLKLSFFVSIVRNSIVELFHLLLKSFETDPNFCDFLFKLAIVLVKSHFLLLHDHLLVG